MASYNVSDSLLAGITVPAGSEIDTVDRNLRVEILELVSGETGEVIKASPINMGEEEIQISGEGPHGKTLTIGAVADPASFVITKHGLNEAPNKHVAFNFRASSKVAFVDPDTTINATGAEPTIDDLEIVTVEYSAAESVRRDYEVTDLVLVGSNGQPLDRATFQEKGSVSIVGRGDVPLGAAAGNGGAAFKGGSVGKVAVPNFGRKQKRGDWNGYSMEANHYKSAA